MYQPDVGTELLNAVGLPSCCPCEVVLYGAQVKEIRTGKLWLHCRDTHSYIEYKAERSLLQAATSNRKQGTTARFCAEDLPQTCKPRGDLTRHPVG